MPSELLTDIPQAGSQTGWPWSRPDSDRTESETHFLNQTFPKITVITPSLNQAAYLEKTIRSVLLQNYPTLEYFIMDGGSTDGSVEIIKKYAAHITDWVSEKDRGMCHAINKGFARASGDIICWLNSDDYFAPDTLHFVARNLPVSDEPAWLVGGVELLDASGNKIFARGPAGEITRDRILRWHENFLPQPSTFWNKAMLRAAGTMDESLSYIMDLDLWLRMIPHGKPQIIRMTLSLVHYHSKSKCITGRKKSLEELKIYYKQRNLVSPAELNIILKGFQWPLPHYIRILQQIRKISGDYARVYFRRTKRWAGIFLDAILKIFHFS